jgi:hypothetical protein
MRLVIFILLQLVFDYSFGQPWYSKTYNVTGGQEVAKAMELNGDTIIIRATHVCDTNLCTILGIFSQSENKFLKLKEHEGVQTGLKHIMQNDSFVFISSEDKNLNKNVSISKFSKFSLDLISHKDLSVDSSKYFNYVIGASLKYFNHLIVASNALDSSNFIGYQGWNNYQEKSVLFVLDNKLITDTILIISPSSGAFLKVEDMAIGPDSILYISFYEKYLKQGNPDKFLEIRKVIYGYDPNFQKVFQWEGPDFDVPESITCLTIGEDSIVYFNYKHDFKSYVAALNPDATLRWECLFDSNPGAYLYNIRRIIKAKNGDVIGVGTISSVVDELGESGFIFRIDQNGMLLWKRAIRINKGMDLILPPEFPFQSNLEDIVELPNGDLVATGLVNKYVGYDQPDGPYNYDIWIVRTNEDGCIWPECSFIQDIIFKDQYIKLVTSNNEWVVDVISPPVPMVINRFSFDPDSILIGDSYYYKLIFTPTLEGQWQETGRLMREESGIVYEYSIVDKSEIVLYDFNYQTGDTMTSHQDGTNNLRKVINVGTRKLADEIIRKTVSLVCTSDASPSDTTTWIEGVGDIDRLFWSKTFCSSEDEDVEKRHLRCFLTDKQVQYSKPGLEGCYITSVDETRQRSIIVFPNPANSTIHFDVDDSLIFSKIILYNSVGQIVISKDQLPSDNNLDIKMLPSGIYYGAIYFQDNIQLKFKVSIL